MLRIRFIPDDIEIAVERGANLLEAAILPEGILGFLRIKGVAPLQSSWVDSGTVESVRTEKILAEEYQNGLRLACQTKILTDLTVKIPVESRLDQAIQASENQKSAGISAVDWKYDPPLKKYYLELPSATIEDNTSDLFRLMQGLKQTCNIEHLPVDFNMLRKLPGILGIRLETT